MKTRMIVASMFGALLLMGCAEQSMKNDTPSVKTSTSVVLSTPESPKNANSSLENSPVIADTNTNTTGGVLPSSKTLPRIESCKHFFSNKYDDSDDQETRKRWEPILKKFYPTFDVVYVGDVCTLSDQTFIVTAALLKTGGTAQENTAKKVIHFDSKQRHLQSTTGLACPNVGDTSMPEINEERSLKNVPELILECTGGDAGYGYTQEMKVNFTTFAHGIFRETSTEYERNKDDTMAREVKEIRELQKDGTWKTTNTLGKWEKASE